MKITLNTKRDKLIVMWIKNSTTAFPFVALKDCNI